MNRISILLNRLLAFVVVALGLAVVGCGDDPAGPSGPTGSSKITVMHANPGYTSDVVFKQDTTTLGRLPYAGALGVNVNNGNRKIDIRATDGSVLTSTDITLDSTVSVWVIFTGIGTDRESFKVSTKKATLSPTNALVRIVHASKNLEPITVKIGDASGPALNTSATPYKQSTDYVSVPPTTTTQLVVLKTNNTQVLVVDVNGKIQAGKAYTIVLYGSTDPSAADEVKLTSKLIED